MANNRQLFDQKFVPQFRSNHKNLKVTFLYPRASINFQAKIINENESDYLYPTVNLLSRLDFVTSCKMLDFANNYLKSIKDLKDFSYYKSLWLYSILSLQEQPLTAE